MFNQCFFCASTKLWFNGLDVISIKQVFLKEIFDHLLLAEIDQHTVDMPAETLTESRATNVRVSLTDVCYSSTSTRGFENEHVVNGIINVLFLCFSSSSFFFFTFFRLFRENNFQLLDGLKAQVFWVITTFVVHKSRPVGKYKQRHPTTVFCKISVRRSKNCLEFSIA